MLELVVYSGDDNSACRNFCFCYQNWTIQMRRNKLKKYLALNMDLSKKKINYKRVFARDKKEAIKNTKAFIKKNNPYVLICEDYIRENMIWHKGE